MNQSQAAERRRLHTLWATGKATKKQILRCMELDKLYTHQDNKKCGKWPNCDCVVQGRLSDCGINT